MAAFSNYAESGLLQHLFRGQDFPKPDNIAIALCSGVPQESDTGYTIPELPTGINGSGTGYSRYDLGDPATLGDAAWLYDLADHNAGSGLIKNASTFVMGTALTDWGWVSGIAIVDSGEYGVGNVIMYSQMGKPRLVTQGDAPKFDPTTLEIKIK